MRKVLIAAVMSLLVTGTMTATEITDVMTSVQRFVDSFNKGDVKAAAAACAEQTSIIDEFPPHEWHGAGACAKWMDEYDADAKKNGITDGIVTLGAPVHVDVTADHAYVVIPADYAFKQKGKPIKETGSIITLSLQKGKSGWLITGWAWAKH
jgi:hypothetical protein